MLFSTLVFTLTLFSVTFAQPLVPFSRKYKTIGESIFFSEEPPSTSFFQSALVAGMKCFGRFCDVKTLITVRDGPEYPVVYTGFKSPWFSEEGVNFANCPSDMVLSQVWCGGRFCDNIQIGCGRLSLGYVVSPRETIQTGLFSEESGGTQLCPDSYYIKGLACDKDYCDNLKFTCVRVFHPKRTVDPCKVLANPRGYLGKGPYFSEENGGYSNVVSEPVAGLACDGRFCDNKRLISIQPGTTKALSTATVWTRWFSEEGLNYANCPTGTILNRIQCGGRFCDSLRLGCGKVSSKYRVVQYDVTYTGFFSEEHGERLCPSGYYVFGMTCGGRYCDDLRLHCVRVQCA